MQRLQILHFQGLDNIPHYPFNLWNVSKNSTKHKINEICFSYGLINAKNMFNIHKYLIKT